jgi:sec-independent protein translocase protein TatA
MLGTTLGAQEIFVIFLLALLLFGPKKLPEIGRTLGKAIIEFRRASNELKSTFDREMQNLEAETGVKKAVSQYNYDNRDYSSYEANEPVYEGTHSQIGAPASCSPTTLSEPATQGAESPEAVVPEGIIVHDSAKQGPNGVGDHRPETNSTAEHSG